MATAKRAPAKKAAPKKEYVHVVMGRHPLSGQAMPVSQPYGKEEDAYKDAANRNQHRPMLQFHVKRIEKGSSGRTT